MPPALSIANDFDLMLGVEPVTLTRRNLDGTAAATYAAVKAVRRVATSAPAGVGPAGAQALATTARWHLKAADLPLGVRAGDTFAPADGSRWEVMDADACALGTRYACTCKRVA